MNQTTLVHAKPLGNGKDSFPRWVLLCAGALLAISLLGVGLVRITGNGPDQLAAAVVAKRPLVFQDLADGGIRVIDGANGDTLTELRGEQGFVRGALRALARERYARGIGSELPFEVIAHVDGRTTLLDSATGQRIGLESFGPTNAAEFSRFLTMKPQ
ncbi:MAG: photosynthetic complex assembly protein PuhC [Burkholderiales bacterium]|jgi:putative photosynthetic complex assembly protein|nr:photosynthetic complex assembly protein PuhC [Burkholderiales bacterium]